MRWLIATPAWGERHVELFTRFSLPAIVAALGGRDARFVIHTDRCVPILDALASTHLGIQFMCPYQGNTHVALGHAHREALALAEPDEAVAFINSDMVPSIEVFDAAERRFAEGKRLIMMAATRTIGAIPPMAATSADLLRWTMAHVHPAVEECFWPSGRTGTPWALYFTLGGNVVCRGFHLHPFALVADKRISFKGKTIDCDLLEKFSADEMHVVTDANEAAFAEMSPPERVFNLLKGGNRISPGSVARWASQWTLKRHRDLFKHRIAIIGDGDDLGDQDVANNILARVGSNDFVARRCLRVSR